MNQDSKNRRQNQGDTNTTEYFEKVIKISRVTKVCKGGKRMSFRALVIVGDQKGSVGVSAGKSKEVPAAIKQGVERAKKDFKKVNIINGTLPHPIIGNFGSAKVMLKPAAKGTGIIAGGAIRVLLEAVGLQNVVAKSLGSDNHMNTAIATLNGLLLLKSKEKESKDRGKDLSIRYVVTDEEFKEEQAYLEENKAILRKKMEEKKRQFDKKRSDQRARKDNKRLGDRNSQPTSENKSNETASEKSS